MMQSAVSKNSTDGNLTFISFYKDGVNGVDGLNQARTLLLLMTCTFMSLQFQTMQSAGLTEQCDW